jgi:hypothetical protein
MHWSLLLFVFPGSGIFSFLWRIYEFQNIQFPKRGFAFNKMTSSCDTSVFTAVLWGKVCSFFLYPFTFHYKPTDLPYKRRQTLYGDMASRPEDLNLDSFTIAGAFNRCYKNISYLLYQYSPQ